MSLALVGDRKGIRSKISALIASRVTFFPSTSLSWDGVKEDYVERVRLKWLMMA